MDACDIETVCQLDDSVQRMFALGLIDEAAFNAESDLADAWLMEAAEATAPTAEECAAVFRKYGGPPASWYEHG